MISTKARYALRVLIDLARNQEEGFVPLKEISKRQEISEKYLEIILKTLVKGKIIKGLRGKGGGYRLVRRPEDYTVGDILRLTEGTLSPVACLKEDARPCDRCEVCRTLPVWKGLRDVVDEYLDGVTLDTLLISD